MTERDIFIAALQQEGAAARQAFLEEACRGDEALRRGVRALLEAHERAGHFLESPAPGLVTTLDEPAVCERPGAAVGPYKLLEPLGEGGFGVVYLAEQARPVRRKVALKVLKPGMDTRQVVARFEQEQQALALMDHPHIAKVLDGGETASGRPYFVMELVKGARITDFCDQGRLGVRERLGLFVSVCQAVQHAHQKGIIHRDLKPSNVLVTPHDDTPVAKVIDFGVAKALGQELTDKTLFTGFAQMLGTPLYMSPEQAGMSGLDVDTRSDVYSLGVLLYELLTGTTPFARERLRGADYDEIRRIIGEEEPPRPSTRMSTLGPAARTVSANRRSEPHKLSALFRGELDGVVLKALEKDRDRRYESASAFAADVQRYLAEEPVLACPPSAAYRFRKFARRHKTALVTASAVALITLLTVAGLATSTVVIAQEKEAAANALQGEVRAKQELQGALARERQDVYFQRIGRAEREWAANNLNRAEQLLAECPADLRGWEWHYLRRLRLGNRSLLRNASAQCAALSPDGDRLALGSMAGVVKLWDLKNGKEVHSFRAHEGQILALAFSPTGQALASASLDKTVKVWETETWKERLVFRGHREGVVTIAFSPDGGRLASAGFDKVLKYWDANTGREVLSLSGHSDTVSHLALSPDGRRAASASLDGTVKVWSLSTGREALTFTGHGQMVLDVAFSPDGRHIASAGGNIWKSDDGAVKLWDATTGKELLTLRGHVGEVSCVAFGRGGTRLVSGGGDQTLRLWDVTTGREALVLHGHSDLVNNVTFSRDGRYLVSTSLDQTVRVWDGRPLEQEAGQEELTLRAPSNAVFRGVTFSPDGRRLASGGADRTVKLWDARTWRELMTFRGHSDSVAGVAFSPDGRRLATASGKELIVWDTATGQEVVRAPDAARSVIFDPTGKRLASASSFDVKVWDAGTGKELNTLRGHTSLVLGIAFSADGTHLASAGSDLTVRLWDAKAGRLIRTLAGHTGRACAVAFSPDGRRLVSGSLDRTVRVWNVETGKEVIALHDPTGGVLGVTFGPDNQRIAWAGMDATVKVWDGVPGSEPHVLRGHTRWIFGVTFSPDGARIASAGADGSVKVWRVPGERGRR